MAKCKDLEQQITKIRTDSSNQLRMSQVKTNEFKAEIAKLNKLLEGGALPPAMTPNVTITKLMQATLKAQKIVVTQQSLLEQQ